MAILVVDDDPDVLDMLVGLLEDEGYSVVGASNGLEAITHLRTNPVRPCVILLDLMMPQMNGWQFRSVQQQDPGLAPIPVIVISAIDTIQREATMIGANAYLPKPINFDRLLTTVEYYCATRA